VFGQTRRSVQGLTQLRARAGPPALDELDMGLVLTHACNLACTYCYTGEKKRVGMPADVAMRAVDFAFAQVREGGRLQLSFFGGEPLLEDELLVAIAERARERSATLGRSLVMQMTTNGTLLRDELLDRLAELGVHVALSIDGTREQHDTARPRVGGGSSWEATMHALRRLLDRRERRPFDVVSVVDPSTVHALGDGVRELVDLGVDSISLNMNWGGAWGEAELAAFERELEVVAAIWIAWLRRGRWVRIQPLESALRALQDLGRVPSASCSAGTRRLAVAPSGRIYGCCRAVGEDTGRGAIGHLDRGMDRAGPGSDTCSCACAEETGDPHVAGPVQVRHDAAVDRVTRRVAALLGSEYELIHIVERGPS
jgi:uncharacterized protein